MAAYLTVTPHVWSNATGFSRVGALILTQHGKRLFIDQREIRDVCDQLHDIADHLETERKGSQRNGY